MIAIEFEAAIVDHRLDVRSDLLPEHADRAKVIVMIEQPEAARADVLALARAAQASFPKRPPELLTRELDDLRAEWGRLP